jgi:hypothetical protein
MASISATPLRLSRESMRVMAGALCHAPLDPTLPKKRKLIGNVRISRVFNESYVMLI